MKWLIMLGFMDLRGPRVCRHSTPVLLSKVKDKFDRCVHDLLSTSATPYKISLAINRWVTETCYQVILSMSDSHIQPLAGKDISLPVSGIPLWRLDDLTTTLSPEWDFLFWSNDLFILNQPPAAITHLLLHCQTTYFGWLSNLLSCQIPSLF